MIYTDNKGRTLDVTVWDGSDVTEDVLGAPRTGAICGQAWSSDMHDYCTGCGVLLNEDCESAVPGWCVWCAGEE